MKFRGLALTSILAVIGGIAAASAILTMTIGSPKNSQQLSSRDFSASDPEYINVLKQMLANFATTGNVKLEQFGQVKQESVSGSSLRRLGVGEVVAINFDNSPLFGIGVGRVRGRDEFIVADFRLYSNAHPQMARVGAIWRAVMGQSSDGMVTSYCPLQRGSATTHLIKLVGVTAEGWRVVLYAIADTSPTVVGSHLLAQPNPSFTTSSAVPYKLLVGQDTAKAEAVLDETCPKDILGNPGHYGWIKVDSP